MNRLLTFLFALQVFGTFAHAEQRIALHAGNLRVGFAVQALGLMPVAGRFADVRGELVFMRSAPGRSRIAVTARTASITTASQSIDARLRSPAFFDAERHPAVTFESTRLVLGRNDRGVVRGILRMLGTSRPIVLQVHLRRQPPGTTRAPFASFHATGRVRRSNWGMTAMSTAIGDEVQLDIAVHPAD